MDNALPAWSFLSRKPASTRASDENGGVFTSPLSHTSGLSLGDTMKHMSVLTCLQVGNSSGRGRMVPRQLPPQDVPFHVSTLGLVLIAQFERIDAGARHILDAGSSPAATVFRSPLTAPNARDHNVGYEIARQRGSHIRLRHVDGSRPPLTVPNHKELKTGLRRRLIRDAGMTVEEFIEAL